MQPNKDEIIIKIQEILEKFSKLEFEINMLMLSGKCSINIIDGFHYMKDYLQYMKNTMEQAIIILNKDFITEDLREIRDSVLFVDKLIDLYRVKIDKENKNIFSKNT